MYRTHTCGQLTLPSQGETVTLSGWVDTRRDLGGLIFLDLRDHYGLTQIVINPKKTPALQTTVSQLRSEWVITVTGQVQKRQTANPHLNTGEIEISAEKIIILSTAETPPFEIDTKSVREEVRLEYRYLDLRRTEMQQRLKLRHEMVQTIRSYFFAEKFLEIETPILIKGTPEGSREYLVPSRVHPGEFYVLPQSPQQLKQLLMVGGVDKYFQIARCFRDEDLRGDRQPEFTQFEIECAFVKQEDVLQAIEGCFHALIKKHAPKKSAEKFFEDGQFKRFTWRQALETYGSDKPDIRFDLHLQNLSDIKSDCGFQVFEQAEYVSALAVPASVAIFSRKDIDKLTECAQQNGASGLAWYRIGEESGAVAKNTTKAFQQKTAEKTAAQPGDIVFFGAGDFRQAVEPLGAVRLAIAEQAGLQNSAEFAFVWVTDFPLFEKKADGTIQAEHHPFTSPHPDDIKLLKTDPTRCRALAYDVVLNGVELGGGSIRIHDKALQHTIFRVLGLEEKEIQAKFGHLLKAFSFGVPPHGGCAMGLDRVVMLFAGAKNIREIMAFPKNLSGRDLMLGAPSTLPKATLIEQNIQILKIQDSR